MRKRLFILVLLNVFLQSYSIAQQTTVKAYFTHDAVPTSKIPEDIHDSIFAFKNPPDSISGLLHFKSFRANMHFNSVTFRGPAQFYTSLFYKDVNLDSSKFLSFADFSNVTFIHDAAFSHVTFHKMLFMSEIQADSVAVINFYNAKLPDLIDFSHNKKLGHIVDFTDADFESPKREEKFFSDTRIFINLFDSDFKKLKLDYLHFRLCFYDPGRLDPLTDSLKKLVIAYEKKHIGEKKNTSAEYHAIYTQMRALKEYSRYIKTIFPSVSLDDKVVKDFTEFYCELGSFPARLSKDQTEAVYSRLVKNFEDFGQKMSYEACDIDRNNFISQFWNLSRIWNRWGYHKELIFYWTVGLLLLLTCITNIFYAQLLLPNTDNDKVYAIEKFPDTALPEKKRKKHRWKCSFIYTSIIFFSFPLKFEKINFSKGWFVYILIVNAVGLLCLGYLANFILQK